MAYFHKFSVRHLEVLSRFFIAILFWLDKVVYKLLISAQASFRVQRSFTPQVLSEVFVDESKSVESEGQSVMIRLLLEQAFLCHKDISRLQQALDCRGQILLILLLIFFLIVKAMLEKFEGWERLNPLYVAFK